MTVAVPTTVAVEALAVGSTASLGTLDVTVSGSMSTDQRNLGLLRGRFLVVDVSLRALGPDPVLYAPTDWNLVVEGIQVDRLVSTDEGRLGFGDLGAGDSVVGTVSFDLASVPEGTDTATVVYESDLGRATWEVGLP